MSRIKLGVIGLGQRGGNLTRDIAALFKKEVEITVLCDSYADRVDKSYDEVFNETGDKPFKTTDYADVLNSDNVEVVLISASWEIHIPLAIESMKAGKITALEVGGAYSIDDCWALVRAYEQTKTPFMFLENCCYGERETMLLNMIQKGILGKVVACSGGYCHDLREEITTGVEKRHYRLRNYLSRNCENYPTHELGPIAQMLNINRGNRMVTLTSMASGSYGLKEYVKEHRAADDALAGRDFAQGDIVYTTIKCAGGETILLELDTTLPRYYSRKLTVHGTKGYYNEESDTIFLEDRHPEDGACNWIKQGNNRGNASELCDEFNTQTWLDFKANPIGGHDGMDYLMLKDFFDCVKNNKSMPIDVYDAASWMCISCLSETSIASGGMPVEIPDFTNGRWVLRSEKL
ncbi:MAG: gfo/Idh/MocA family oxidoreductase [Clostridia bacterium]|nr:gfo/Idh/MocA family oxidoreductase [Clostridia bacterium]